MIATSEYSTESMVRKPLSTTGETIPEIGIGTWRFCGNADLLRRGIESGAAFVDTAESYGTEEVVGRAIRGIRDRVFVATKTCHWRFNEVLEAADNSLRRLDIDHVDLYQIHWWNAAIPIEETMSAMEHLVDQGKVRFIGVSNFTVRELKRAQRALRKHRVVSNQVRYSLIERTIEPQLLPYCTANSVTIIAYSPLGEDFQRVLCADPSGALEHVSAQRKKSKAQIALNWCIRKDGIVAIPKTHSAAHMIENTAASGWRLSDQEGNFLSNRLQFRRRSRAEVAFRRCVRGMLQWKAFLLSGRRRVMPQRA